MFHLAALRPRRGETAGWRVTALDTTTVSALREHKARQLADGGTAGARLDETGYVFTILTGKFPAGRTGWTRLFRKLVTAPEPRR